MKAAMAATLLFTVLAAVVVAALADIKAVKALEMVGIPADLTKESVYYSLTGGYLNYPNPMSLKKIAAGQRAEAVREIVAFAKGYVRSDDFKNRYMEYRNNQKPEPPEKPKPMAQQRAEQKAQLQQSIKETETNMKSLLADQRQMLQPTVEMMKQQLKEYDNPENPMFSKQMEEMQKQMYDMQMEEHRTKTAEWEQKYPVDAKPMIRGWLTKFLDETKDVDFSAALKDGPYGKKIFVNPAYENKSSNWKMAYRAGRDVVETGRAAARQWLEELK